MTIFAVTGNVKGVGKVQHSIKAADQQAAWDRFKRAYARRTCKLVQIRRPEPQTYAGDPA